MHWKSLDADWGVLGRIATEDERTRDTASASWVAESILKRHAYMIMAHNEFGVLAKLLELLDDERNDIYVHVDAKVADFSSARYDKIVRRANLTFTPRIRASWGGYSLIRCEIILLREALRKTHSYYHLLSGVDLPLKGQNEIHAFFDAHEGQEFVHFDSQTNVDYRLKYYYFFQEFLSRRQGRWATLLKKANTTTQEAIGVDRLRQGDLTLKFGAQWFSITEAFARHVVASENLIRKRYRYSLCCDEVFLQTLLFDSVFKGRLFISATDSDYRSCLRYVDWQRGDPYTFRSSDYQELICSPYLFARKFSQGVDANVVEQIYQHVKHEPQ